MLHAQAVANGADFEWVHAGEASEEILDEWARLSEIDVADLLE
tara:strand:- start:2519 stop:2647 length:129 start_codon:yes stop_codon:yes gene_type:complete